MNMMNSPTTSTAVVAATTTTTTTTTLNSLKTLLNQTTTTISSLQLQIPNLNQTQIIKPIQYPTFHNINNNKFFYRNYPSPVTITPPPPPLLSLPISLSQQCNNHFHIQFPFHSITFLPSDISLIITEIQSSNLNNNYYYTFSIRLLRVFIRLWECNLLRVSDYVVTRSLHYGLVIDLQLTDYLMLLVKLCCKAIARDAVGVLGNVDGFEGRYECVVFREVVGWLGDMFALLYGVNGRVFAVEVVKECVLESAYSGSLFVIEGEKQSEREGLSVGESVITVELVGKAVNALYERSLVEENSRVARDQGQMSAYQRNMDHTYVTKVAEEERRKRPDYKPIIEHDSLLWNQSRNQATNKTKTREELLAEERDYKRRRMSYRGKKSKRNAVEVMRDIIDVYMEEIKQSGMMGSTSESVEEAVEKNKHLEDYTNNQSSSRDYHDHQDLNKNVGIIKNDRYDYLEMREGRQSGSHSREPHHRERRDRSKSKSLEENYHNTERHKREYNNRKRDRDEDDREYRESGRRRTKRYDRERDEDYSTHRNREKRKTNRSSSSHPERFNEFEDRYDPTDSREES